MTETQKQELVDLVEAGSKDPNVGYYYSACVMAEHAKGKICADKWGFALIGKFGNAAVACREFRKLNRSLPESNPFCLQMLYAVAQLLGIENWQELVEIHYACQSGSESREIGIRELKDVLLHLEKLTYARSVLADAFRRFEEQLADLAAASGA